MANEEQVKILKQGVEVWNKWRKENPGVKPDLSETDLSGADLRGADLIKADLSEADLGGANLSGADLSEADLTFTCLSEAVLIKAHLIETILIKADLTYAYLGGANFLGTKLQGTDFTGANVDGETLVSYCEVDRKTNFELVGLGNMRIDSGTRQLLEYNIRKKKWIAWCYPKPWRKRVLKLPIGLPTHLFWLLSNFGKSTGRIVFWFIVLSFLFAVMYWRSTSWLVVEGADGITDLLHACYFSIVTMTTLGFGDIHAHPESHAGQIALMIQVLLGYVMLGALVTRFAVLFSAGGPAGKFVPMSKKEKRKLNDIHKKEAKRLNDLWKRMRKNKQP